MEQGYLGGPSIEPHDAETRQSLTHLWRPVRLTFAVQMLNAPFGINGLSKGLSTSDLGWQNSGYNLKKYFT